MNSPVGAAQTQVAFAGADTPARAGVLAGVVVRHRPYDAHGNLPAQPELEYWLSEGEQKTLAKLRDNTRRTSWWAGRLLAKQLIRDEAALEYSGLEYSGLEYSGAWELQPSRIEITSADGAGRGMAPRITVNGKLLEYSSSIAHSATTVVAALSRLKGRRVGVDITARQAQSESFSRLWLTPGEQEMVKQTVSVDAYLVSRLWAIKEAFYKATNTGGPFVPAHIEVRVGDNMEWSVWPGSRRQARCDICVLETAEEVIAIVLVDNCDDNSYDDNSYDGRSL